MHSYSGLCHRSGASRHKFGMQSMCIAMQKCLEFHACITVQDHHISGLCRHISDHLKNSGVDWFSGLYWISGAHHISGLRFVFQSRCVPHSRIAMSFSFVSHSSFVWKQAFVLHTSASQHHAALYHFSGLHHSRCHPSAPKQALQGYTQSSLAAVSSKKAVCQSLSATIWIHKPKT